MPIFPRCFYSLSFCQDVFAIYLVYARRLSFFLHIRRRTHTHIRRGRRKRNGREGKNRNPFDCRKEIPECSKKSPVYLRFECTSFFRWIVGSFVRVGECVYAPFLSLATSGCDVRLRRTARVPRNNRTSAKHMAKR